MEVKAYRCDELVIMSDGSEQECGALFEEYDDLRAHKNSNAHR